MSDFMGLALVFTGMVIVGISLYVSRHGKTSRNLEAIRRGLSDEQVNRIFQSQPKRSDAYIGLYFGLFFITVGIVRIGFVWWFWSHV